jgi:hypothetical protein
MSLAGWESGFPLLPPDMALLYPVPATLATEEWRNRLFSLLRRFVESTSPVHPTGVRA